MINRRENPLVGEQLRQVELFSDWTFLGHEALEGGLRVDCFARQRVEGGHPIDAVGFAVAGLRRYSLAVCRAQLHQPGRHRLTWSRAGCSNGAPLAGSTPATIGSTGTVSNPMIGWPAAGMLHHRITQTNCQPGAGAARRSAVRSQRGLLRPPDLG